MILATGNFSDMHVGEPGNQGWKHDSVFHIASEAKLALVGIAAAEDLIVHCDKDGMSASRLKVLHWFVIESLCWDQLWTVAVV